MTDVTGSYLDLTPSRQTRYFDDMLDAQIAAGIGNYVTDDLIGLLASHGFEFDVPTYLIGKAT